MLKDTFASRFKEAREAKGVTIKSMIPVIDVSPSAMNNYATGKTLPPLDVALRIADYLEISLDWLIGRGPSVNVRRFRCRSCYDAVCFIDALQHCFNYTETSVEKRSSEDKYFVHLSIESKLLYDFYEKIFEMEKVKQSLPDDLSFRMKPILRAAQQRLIDELVEKQQNSNTQETGMKQLMRI